MRIKLVVRWRPLVLCALVLGGLILRLYGLNWDQGNSFHPDERQILFKAMPLGWPASLAQFLDPVNSPLNPHFFSYGSFPLYLLALLGHLLIHTQADPFPSYLYLGRVLSALFDSGTILLTACIGLLLSRDAQPGRPYAWNVAFLVAALVAFTPLQLQLSHFYAVDTVLLFFVMLTLLACVALVETERPTRWLIIAGVGYGLALATKFSAAPLAVPLCVSLLLRWYQRRDTWAALSSLCLAGIFTLAVFLLAMPYALLDMHNFISDISQQGGMARGIFDVPYVRQFAGTTPFLYEAQNMLLWGLGVTLGLAALAGLLWMIWRVARYRAGSWLIILSWVLVYGAISGSFYVKFMRYMLPIYPALTLMAAAALLSFARYEWKLPYISINAAIQKGLRTALIALVLAGTIFQGLALLNVYSQPNTRIQASRWMYSHLKPGSVLTYEQWDDSLPVAVDGHDPSIFVQASTGGNGATGLDLYGDDTTDKARMLANLLPTIDAITMPTDRLDKSIPRLPARYPLTIHYYQLLFSGQLGFHLAAQFDNRPNLLGITLDDSSADESYSVFDHPTARIFVRDTPYPYTSDQLFQKLLDGVQLPAPGAGLSGAQQPLLLTQQQIDTYQNSAPFGVQFPATSLSNSIPLFFWWLTLLLLGILAYPLVFLAFRALADHGYLFGKTLSILVLAYLSWVLAAGHVLAFNRISLLLVAGVLLLSSAVAFVLQRYTIITFVRQRWKLLLTMEAIFTFAYLLLALIRAFNPDLWHVYRGGEKPMELAFLNAVLRSPYAPPQDPWFSGGYINYYYYGYVIIGALIKLTGIVPTTAFNLALPTLFALTFSGAVIIVYSLARSFPIALLGGYFAALIGNFNGLAQLRGQIGAMLAHVQVPLFDYWQSSRVIPLTINEFPFWSFIFADLHPHVIDMPIEILMLGILAALLLPTSPNGPSHSAGQPQGIAPGHDEAVPTIPATTPSLSEEDNSLSSTVDASSADDPSPPTVYAPSTDGATRSDIDSFIVSANNHPGSPAGIESPASPYERPLLYLFAAFTIGTIACVNPWDMPLYVLLLAAVLVIQRLLFPGRVGIPLRGATGETKLALVMALALRLGMAAAFYALGYLFYWPFYASYQQLYVNGIGTLQHGSEQGDYLTVFGLWIFLATSFFLVEAYYQGFGAGKGKWFSSPWRILAYVLLSVVILAFLLTLGIKVLLAALFLLGSFLFILLLWRGVRHTNTAQQNPHTSVALQYSYLLLLMGLGIGLGIELVYIRDFLDGGDWERMNTVFKFSMQLWLCMAIGGALAVQHLWRRLGGLVRRVWMAVLVALLLSCSIFLTEGTVSRIQDHQIWIDIQPPAASANYTPTLDGFAFVRAWYPDDARGITWLNEHVSGSPVILEAAGPESSYQWFNRISVFTGLPDVLGWPDHVGEQRYDTQPLNRMTDIITIYTTPDSGQALELLRYYHVRYIYVGPLERQTYTKSSSAGLDKFDQMVGSSLRVAYHSGAVTIYELL